MLDISLHVLQSNNAHLRGLHHLLQPRNDPPYEVIAMIEVGQKYYRNTIHSLGVIQFASIISCSDTHVVFNFKNHFENFTQVRKWEIDDFKTEWTVLTPLTEALL